MKRLLLFLCRGLCLLCVCAPVVFGGCSPSPTLPPRHAAVQRPDPRVPLGQPVIPTIGEGEVRQWFAMVKIPDFRFSSLSNEFHPDDGNLLATYTGGSGRMIYLSYVDNVRMSRYAFPRSAKEIVRAGNGGGVQRFECKGWKWFGASAPMPILAADVGPNVKVVLVGYSGVPLKDLAAIASGLPMQALAQFAATGPRSKL